MSSIYIIDAKRTAIGKFLGSLYEADPKDVCVQLIKNGFKEEYIKEVESVIVGNVISAGIGQATARNIAINAGVPLESPAYSLNEVCGSGRITTTLAHIVKRENLKYGIASLCIGGGMGAALLLWRVKDNEFA